MAGEDISIGQAAQVANAAANTPDHGYDPDQWKKGVAAAGSGAASGAIAGGPVGAFVGALAGWFSSGGAGAAVDHRPAYWNAPMADVDIEADTIRLFHTAALNPGNLFDLTNAVAAADPSMLPSLASLNPGIVRAWWSTFLAWPQSPARAAFSHWVATHPPANLTLNAPLFTAGKTLLLSPGATTDKDVVLLIDGANDIEINQGQFGAAPWNVLNFGDFVRRSVIYADRFFANPRPSLAGSDDDATHVDVIRQTALLALNPNLSIGTPVFPKRPGAEAAAVGGAATLGFLLGGPPGALAGAVLGWLVAR